MKNNFTTFLLVIIVFLFSACSQSGRFGISQRYNLSGNEKERNLDKLIVDKYESVINVDSVNIPLNKFFHSTEYKVYVGVSFNHNAQKLLNVFKKDTLFTILESSTNKDSVSIFFSKNKDFYYSLFYDSPKDKYSYVLTLEGDSAIAYNKYKNHFLSKKVAHGN